MTHDLPTNSSLPRDTDTVLIAEESKSFAAFDEWMDHQLAILEARWIHAAAPNASRPQRLRKAWAK